MNRRTSTRPQTRRDRIFVRVVVSLLLAAFIWIFCIPAWQNVRDSYSAASWTSTEGTVVESRSYSSRRRKGGTQTNYVFEYRYTVNGEQFSSHRYSFREPGGDKHLGVRKYDKDEKITVCFNPRNPGRAVIDRYTSLWWNYLVLLIFSTIVFMFACSQYSKYAKQRRAAASNS